MTAAKDIRRRLNSNVSVISHQFAREYRGHLLEYRRGAIVALDQEDPVQPLLNDTRTNKDD